MLRNILRKHNRADEIFDCHFPRSIKTATRIKGEGQRYHVTSQTPIPRNWNLFLRNSENKTLEQNNCITITNVDVSAISRLKQQVHAFPFS